MIKHKIVLRGILNLQFDGNRLSREPRSIILCESLTKEHSFSTPEAINTIINSIDKRLLNLQL